MANPLIATKLHVPRLRADIVHRQRLLELLDQGAQARLTLVSAPAGFGKTTLLVDWLATRRTSGRSVAWVSLDQTDNEAAAFWAHLIAALGGAAKELGEALLINPNSTEEMAEAIKQALEMPLAEQKHRNAAMQKRLRRYNVVAWAKDFVREVNQTCIEHDILVSKVPTNAEEEQLLSAYRDATRRLILLDYDGTLVAFSSDPQAVKPS